MKILIDVRLLWRGGQSGVEEYTQQVVDHLLRLQPHHSYTLFYNGWKKLPLPAAWTERPNVTVLDWHCPNNLLQVVSPNIGRRAAADLVFSPHINYLNHGPVPRVLTIHDLSFLHFPQFFSRRQRLWHWLQRIRRQAERAAIIVTDSEFSRQNICDTLGIPPEKARVVSPGLHPMFTHVLRTTPRPPHYPKSYILYLGTIEPRKNIIALIKAFSLLKVGGRIPDTKLVLAGRPGWLYHDVYKEAAQSPARGDIVFWGPVAAEEKPLLYTKAEVFVYPSFFEGFGFPPLEAQACGTPVIIANRASLPEVVGEGALRVHPWRTHELAEAVTAVLENSSLRERLTRAGRENSRRFTWHQCAVQLSEIFSSYF